MCWLWSSPRPREASKHFPCLFSQTHSNNKIESPASPWKELVYASSISTFTTAIQGTGKPPNHVTLISNGDCIHESCKIIAEKWFLIGTGALSTTIHTAIHTGLVQRKYLPSSPWDWLLSQMLPESPAPTQPASRCWLNPPHFGTLMILAHSQLLGTIKNKDSHLQQQATWARLMDKIHSYMRQVWQHWKR